MGIQRFVLPVLVACLVGTVIRRVDLDADTNGDWSQVPPWPVFRAVMSLASWLPRLESKLLPPHVRVAGVASAFIQSRALHVAAQLDVADALAAGPLPVEELAKSKGVRGEHLARVLRLLTTVGIFREVQPGVFANNRASGVLRRDHPTSVHDLVMLYGDESYWGFLKLPEAMAQDHPTGNPFMDVSGMAYWEWIDLPENKGSRGARFDRAMVAIAGWNIPPLLQDYDWSQHANQTVADIGGGMGGVLSALMEHQPSIRGILFDRPAEIERARELWAQQHSALLPRADLVAGDFFQAVPPADVYFAQHILHDWPDASCVRILQTLRRSKAQAGGGTDFVLLISDIVMADSQPGLFKAALDLQMMALPGGKERTESQWAALLEAGGFKLERVVHIRALDSILVARPLAE